MGFLPNSEKWNHFPLVSMNAEVQARRDAETLADFITGTADIYGIEPDRMARALTELTRQWTAWAAKRQP